MRFKAIYPVNRKDYNKRLRKEVLEIYDVTLTSEAIRRLISSLRNEIENQTIPKIDTEITTSEDTELLEEVIVSDIIKPDAAANLLENNKITKNTDNPIYFKNAGLLILNLWLQKFVSELKVNTTPLIQWLYQILYGAVNFEQTKNFPRQELEVFTGCKTVRITQSRDLLWTMAYKDFDNYVCRCIFSKAICV